VSTPLHSAADMSLSDGHPVTTFPGTHCKSYSPGILQQEAVLASVMFASLHVLMLGVSLQGCREGI